MYALTVAITTNTKMCKVDKNPTKHNNWTVYNEQDNITAP